MQILFSDIENIAQFVANVLVIITFGITIFTLRSKKGQGLLMRVLSAVFTAYIAYLGSKPKEKNEK